MIIYLLKKFFSIIIGKLPEEQKRKLWARFNVLLMDITKAAVSGATENIIRGSK